MSSRRFLVLGIFAMLLAFAAPAMADCRYSLTLSSADAYGSTIYLSGTGYLPLENWAVICFEGGAPSLSMDLHVDGSYNKTCSTAASTIGVTNNYQIFIYTGTLYWCAQDADTGVALFVLN